MAIQQDLCTTDPCNLQHSTLTPTPQHSTLRPPGPLLGPEQGLRKMLRLSTTQHMWLDSHPCHPTATSLLCILGPVVCVPPNRVAFAPESPVAPCGGQHPSGKAWEEENPGILGTSHFPGQRAGLGWGAAAVPTLPPTGVGMSLPLSGKGLGAVKWRGQCAAGQGLQERTRTHS